MLSMAWLNTENVMLQILSVSDLGTVHLHLRRVLEDLFDRIDLG